MSSKIWLMAFVFGIASASCGGFERGKPTDDSDETDTDTTTDDDDATGDELSFETDVEPILEARCSSCHGSGGIASASAFRYSGDATSDYTSVTALISTSNPSSSELLLVASGQSSHGGGTVLPAASDDYDTILNWISGGAAP